jgi:hypothetical protein
MVKATTTKVSLIVAALALAMALAAAASLGLSPAHAIPDCDVPKPPPICPGEERPPPPKPQPPQNDAFSGAFTLSLPSIVTGTTARATMEPGEPAPHSPTKDCGIFGVSNSVWYRFTPQYEGNLKLNTEGSSFDTVLALYTGSSLSSLQQVECSNDNSLPNWTDRLYAPVSAGQTYYVQLSGTGGARSGAYKLNATWCYYYSSDQRFCPIIL